MSLFTGSGVAIVTPFNDDDKVDYEEFARLIDFQINNSTDAIIVMGTTGEAVTVDTDEFKEIVTFCVNHVAGRVPVIAGSGSNDSYRAVKYSNIANEAGVDGLLIVTPYYNKGSERGIYEHYKQIADSVTVPIILYNVPSRTNVCLSVENVLKLSKHENIIGIKEASGTDEYTKSIIEVVGPEFDIYSGNDDRTDRIIEMGGVGVISVLANILPKEMHELCESCFRGEYELANNILSKYAELDALMYIEVNPIPVKKALEYMGYKTKNLRLPLFELDEKYCEQLKSEMKKFNLLR